MQNSTLIWIILGALVLLGGGWYFVMNNSTPADTEVEQEEMMEENETPGPGPGAAAEVEMGLGIGDSSEEGAAPMSAQINYSASGFSPSTVTVRVSGDVTWTSQGGAQMWVASAQHPTHSAYDGTTLQEHCGSGGDSLDQCANGSVFSFTFDKAGTWRYHNHTNPSHFGTVIVEE